eukprot:3274403-Alexandrium_andersonii.AAC.1
MGSTCTGFGAHRRWDSFVRMMDSSTAGPPMRAMLSLTSRFPSSGDAGRPGLSCTLGSCPARGCAAGGPTTVSSGPATAASPWASGT